MANGVRVVIADDHPLVREGTRRILEAESDIEIVGEASDGDEAVDLVDRLLPDVAILDIGMPRLNGLEATRRIKADHPETAVLVLTVHDDDQYVFALIDAGAAGYLLKDVRGTELVRAVRALQDGESVLHPAITRKVLGRFRSGGDEPEAVELTPRELQVLQLVAEGLSNSDIGAALDVSARTVQVHLGSVFKKLGVASRTEAVVRGLRRGLLEIDQLDGRS